MLSPTGIPDAIRLVVVGAHLTGMPLNHQLLALGAELVRADKTWPLYRLYDLPDAEPPKPGLLRVGETNGRAIDVEVWSLAAAAFGAFVSLVPAPLTIGTIVLSGGDREKGFLVEAVAVDGARDISGFGGWRSYRGAATADA